MEGMTLNFHGVCSINNSVVKSRIVPYGLSLHSSNDSSDKENETSVHCVYIHVLVVVSTTRLVATVTS